MAVQQTLLQFITLRYSWGLLKDFQRSCVCITLPNSATLALRCSGCLKLLQSFMYRSFLLHCNLSTTGTDVTNLGWYHIQADWALHSKCWNTVDLCSRPNSISMYSPTNSIQALISSQCNQCKCSQLQLQTVRFNFSALPIVPVTSNGTCRQTLFHLLHHEMLYLNAVTVHAAAASSIHKQRSFCYFQRK